MAKLTISKAAKVFDVSRPTLLKHLNNGKISGEKVTDKGWQIDTAELARVYAARLAPGQKQPPETLSPVSIGLESDLKAEVEELKRSLAVAEALAEDRGKRLDQAMRMLEAPKRRGWWPWA